MVCRVLGIETSSRRGTVALVEDGQVVASLGHDVPNGHAERMLGLVDQALAEAGWAKASLDRIAVGVGPGSFTGIRVGIALAQGLALGLDYQASAQIGSVAATYALEHLGGQSHAYSWEEFRRRYETTFGELPVPEKTR